MRFGKILFLAIFVVSLVLMFFLGLEHGARKERARLGSMIEVDAEQQMALYLEVLGEIERGDVGKARWMLQSGSASRLDLIVDFSDFDERSHEKFRCALLKRYKKYYVEKRLFLTDEWASMMQVDDVKEAVEKRGEFLEKKLPIICG